MKDLSVMMDRKNLTGVEALVLRPFGRVGNQFATIINALIVCRAFGVRNLVIQKFETLFSRDFVTTLGINIWKNGSRTFNSFVRTHCWAWKGYRRCSSWLMKQAADSIRDEVLRLFPKPNISENTLVMNFRGGDIFQDENAPGHQIYGQPCCQYYLDAMKRDDGHDNVLLMSEDLANPCIPYCINQGAIWHIHTSWRIDMAILLWARRIVLSRSTFMRPVMYLSPVTKVWYDFGGLNITDCGCGKVWYYVQPFGPHWRCIPSNDYQRDIILSWNINKMRRIITENCTWVWIKDINTSHYPLVS
jgi:hypothetical protein